MDFCLFSFLAGLELNSKKKKLEWETDDNDDDIDIEKTLELRQVRATHESITMQCFIQVTGSSHSQPQLPSFQDYESAKICYATFSP